MGDGWVAPAVDGNPVSWYQVLLCEGDAGSCAAVCLLGLLFRAVAGFPCFGCHVGTTGRFLVPLTTCCIPDDVGLRHAAMLLMISSDVDAAKTRASPGTASE